jgi:glycosyltransferase involved in cell wall biosynthesis
MREPGVTIVPMRLVCVTHFFPLPLAHGGAVRVHGLLRSLAERHELHVLALEPEPFDPELRTQLSDELRAPVEMFRRDAAARSATRRWARALARRHTPWVDEQLSSALRTRLRELASTRDAVVILDDYAGSYAAAVEGVAPVVADKSNVLGWSTITHVAPDRVLRDRARRVLALQLARSHERRYLRHVELVTVTSEEESRRLETLYGRSADRVVPSAVDVPVAVSPLRHTRTVGWLGHLAYGPNVEGLVEFVRSGWDELGRDGFELLVAGGGVPPEVQALERHQGVRVLGYVDDLERGFLDRLGMAVVPLWLGAGVKLKTLTLMAAGVPVVSTPVGVEGIRLTDGQHCLVAERPAELAAGLRAVAADEALAGRLSQQGRRLVRDQYSWDAIGPAFVEVVERAVPE